MNNNNPKLKIAIDASRAFVKNRTGIEEYSYQVIKNLRKILTEQSVVLYLRPGDKKRIDFSLPQNWQTKELLWGYFWTQSGLSLELLFRPVDVLFVPAHTLPFIHPRRSYVTVHGLEYEFSPQSYSWRSRNFHRFFIKKSCRWAEKIIAVSENTKRDLQKLYKVKKTKIDIISEGYKGRQGGHFLKEERSMVKQQISNGRDVISALHQARKSGYLFFIGRLEERKNIIGIIKAFEILKEKYNYPGKLLLGGGQGYGYEQIKKTITSSKYKKDIVELRFVDDGDKWIYLKQADIFLFPSFSEGFGIPILEAQSMGTPVVTSNKSPMQETVGDKRVIANPNSPNQIAKIANDILQDEELRKSIIDNGLKNIKKFSWQKTAQQIREVLLKEAENGIS